MNEQKLLAAALQSRQAWSVIQSAEPELSPEGSIILGLADAYYQADADAEHVDNEILQARVDREITSNKVANFIKAELNKLKDLDVSSLNVAKEALALKAHGLGLRIASLLAAGKQDKTIPSMMLEYSDLISRDTTLGDIEDELYTSTKAGELVSKSFTEDSLIQLWPTSLNDHIDGGLRGGHHVLVFAPTEMGKTLFVINAVAGFLRQGLRVLYVGNEDPASDIMLRLMSRLTGLNKYEIIENPDHADSILANRNWDRFTFANLAPGTFPRIHRLLEKYEAEVLVIDQLRNIDVAAEGRTVALERAATEARNTAKRFNIPVISVTQAADSASGKRILSRGDVDSSNVGIPGQVDLMIGIGADAVMEDSNLRMLSFPKNKLSGKHEPLSITINPILSKVEG